MSLSLPLLLPLLLLRNVAPDVATVIAIVTGSNAQCNYHTRHGMVFSDVIIQTNSTAHAPTSEVALLL